MTTKSEARGGEVAGEVELPEWAEVEAAGWSSIGSGVPGEGAYLTDTEVTVEGALEEVRPVFERLRSGLAEARAEIAAGVAREGDLRRKLGEVQAEVVLLSSDMAQDDNEQLCRVLDGIANGIERALAAPAPKPSALLALLKQAEADAPDVAWSAHHLVRVLRAAIGLPPAETGGTA